MINKAKFLTAKLKPNTDYKENSTPLMSARNFRNSLLYSITPSEPR